MTMFSPRYLHTAIKKHDGIYRGSSSLWGARMCKAFGTLPVKEEHQIQFDDNSKFDYTPKQIACGRKFRIGFYKRLFEPENFVSALHFCPIQIDIEIFDSIYNDRDGIITMPDEDDKQEEFSHSVTLLKFNKSEETFSVYTNWPWWGNNGYGLLPLEYLKKYLLSAFVMTGFPKLEKIKREEILKRKFKLNNQKYYFHIFSENHFYCDERSQLNIEIIGPSGDLVGWIHLAVSKEKIAEILDMFVLKEFRKRGIGSFMIRIIRECLQISKITGYIDAHDLVREREEILKGFFLKNDFLVIVDRSKYKDCRFKLEPFLHNY